MEHSEDMELWWELTRAPYLVVPRSVIQEMPKSWQDKMAALLDELDENIDWRPQEGRKYFVQLGIYDEEIEEILEVADPLREYRHGNDHAHSLKKKEETKPTPA